MNVFDESSPARLKKFLAARPVPPEYAVAIDAEKTATREWLRPLDVSGIPFALAVRGGRILWKGNPNALSPELLRALCDENFSQEKRKSETREREGAARAELVLEAVESIAPRLATIPDPEIPDDDEED